MVGVGAHFFEREQMHTAPIAAAAELPRLVALLPGAARLGGERRARPSRSLSPLAVWWLVERTRAGFRLRAVGASPDAAATSGISVPRVQFLALALSGAVAGLGRRQLRPRLQALLRGRLLRRHRLHGHRRRRARPRAPARRRARRAALRHALARRARGERGGAEGARRRAHRRHHLRRSPPSLPTVRRRAAEARRDRVAPHARLRRRRRAHHRALRARRARRHAARSARASSTSRSRACCSSAPSRRRSAPGSATAPLAGVLGGVAGGAAFGALYALFVVTLRGDQIVCGVALNLLADGLTRFFLKATFDSSSNSPRIDAWGSSRARVSIALTVAARRARPRRRLHARRSACACAPSVSIRKRRPRSACVRRAFAGSRCCSPARSPVSAAPGWPPISGSSSPACRTAAATSRWRP